MDEPHDSPTPGNDDARSNPRFLWTVFGIAIGTAVGAAMDQLAIGIAIGVGVGTGVGLALSRRDDGKRTTDE